MFCDLLVLKLNNQYFTWDDNHLLVYNKMPSGKKQFTILFFTTNDTAILILVSISF